VNLNVQNKAAIDYEDKLRAKMFSNFGTFGRSIRFYTDTSSPKNLIEKAEKDESSKTQKVTN